MITVPDIKSDAPTHHIIGNFSPKMASPSKAVKMKLAEVFTIDASIDDGASDNARVYRPHMIPEKTKDRMKTSCGGMLSF